MQGQFTVVGITTFNDTVEGVLYNFTKLNLMLPYPRKNENQAGFNVVQAQFGDSSNLAMFKGLKFPLQVNVDYENTTKGIELYDVEIIKNPAPQVPPKA